MTEAAEWLKRVTAASHNLNYEGVVTYYQGAQIEISQINHYVQSGLEYQKMVSLNGPLRETVRMDNEIRCYIPSIRTVRVMPNTFRNLFPSFDLVSANTLIEHYTFTHVENDRLAGRDVQMVLFSPKDGYRYAHKFWVDQETGLLLAGHLIDLKKQEALERFAFMEVKINAPLPNHFKMMWPELPANWKTEHMGGGENLSKETVWQASALPAGFVKIAEEQRLFTGKTEPVSVLVYSDGLATVSVFVDRGDGPTVASRSGDIDLGVTAAYVRTEGGYRVTAMGRVPHDTLRLIAQGITHK